MIWNNQAEGLDMVFGVQRMVLQGPLTLNLFSKPTISGKWQGQGVEWSNVKTFPLTAYWQLMLYNFLLLTAE